MIIFLIALLAISLVAFIAFLFSKSRTKKRNLLLSGIVAIASLVTLGVVNAQSGDETGNSTEPKTEDTASNNESKNNDDSKDEDTSNTNDDSSTQQPATDDNQTNTNSDNKNDTTDNTQSNKPTYRAATYELDKAIATTSIGSSTMTLEEYNSLTINQLTLEQTLAKYGVPSNTSGGTEGSTTLDIFYPTNQTNYSVDLQYTKSTSGKWILSTKNSIKTTGINAPRYSRQ